MFDLGRGCREIAQYEKIAAISTFLAGFTL
jgi:hypothetical protein